MLNLFGKNAFARKRKAKVMQVDTTSRIETLEDRAMLAGNITAAFNAATGNLTISGDGLANAIGLDFAAGNAVTLDDVAGTTINLAAGNVGPFNVTGSIFISLGSGGDTLTLDGAAGATLDGNINVDMGASDAATDTLTTTSALAVGGNITVVGGIGIQSLSLGVAGSVLSANDISINTGTGPNDKTAVVIATTARNLTIVNGGTGVQTATVGTAGNANTFTGNVSISKTVIGGSIDTNVAATTIGTALIPRNLTITNANATTSDVDLIAGTVVLGTTTVTNGNATAGDNSISFTGASTYTGRVVARNGTSSANNTIDTNAGTFSNTSTFSNSTAATSNTINLGVTATVFTGAVSATNSSATGANAITIGAGTVSNGANLNNAVVGAASNIVSVGNVAAVGLTGTLNINNAQSVTTNDVNLDQLTVSAGTGKTGHINITNGGSATVQNDIGITTANVTFAGNLNIRNQSLAAGSVKNTNISQTVVNGGTGVSVNDVGVGASAVSVGVAGTATVANLLRVANNSTSGAAVDLRAATLGSFIYNDFGGGIDTIDIGGTGGAGTVTINTITNVNTGAGNDLVRIGTTGTAVFNDQVFIQLGAGNDTLTVGANAASPAFNSGTNNFYFDGGSNGVTGDAIAVNIASIGDYTAPLPGNLLKNKKVLNFEAHT